LSKDLQTFVGKAQTALGVSFHVGKDKAVIVTWQMTSVRRTALEVERTTNLQNKLFISHGSFDLCF